MTTAVAVAIGLVVVNVIQPDAGAAQLATEVPVEVATRAFPRPGS